MAIQPMTDATFGGVASSAEYNKVTGNIRDLDTRVTANTDKNTQQDQRLTAVEGSTAVPPKAFSLVLGSGNPSAAGSWRDWAGTITIASPPVNAVLTAQASMMFTNTAGVTGSRLRILISFDGGATWTNGQEFMADHGTTNGAMITIPALGFLSGTTSGSVQVRVQIYCNHASTVAGAGQINCMILAQ